MLRFRWMLMAVSAAALVAITDSSTQTASGQAAGCPPTPAHLSPKGNPSSRFTMLLRVNKPKNVGHFAELQAARGQIRNRDIFLVNTRFKGSNPNRASEIVDRLALAFPCNRIVALNGLGANPDRPGYALSLIDRPELWAVMLDWERRDWGRARATNPSLSRWKRKFGRSLNRLRVQVGNLADRLDAAGTGIGKIGAIPSFFKDWNYGRIARALDHHNRRFGARRGGIQVVATQESCKKSHGREQGGMRAIARRLHRQYGKKNRKKRNLALQISFSDRARAKRNLPIRSVNEGRAAKCIRRGLRAKGGAFLLWASPDSVWDLFETRRLRKLRRPHG